MAALTLNYDHLLTSFLSRPRSVWMMRTSRPNDENESEIQSAERVLDQTVKMKVRSGAVDDEELTICEPLFE